MQTKQNAGPECFPGPAFSNLVQQRVNRPH
jgi:hypothetical protein